jgi:hypothetical protein
VGRGRCTGLGVPTERSWQGLKGSLAFKRWARGRCFSCLECGHQVRACSEPFRYIRCCRPGHRERFYRARSPAVRDPSPAAHTRSLVAQAPCQQWGSSFVIEPCCTSLTQSWAEVVGCLLLPMSVPPRPPSGGTPSGCYKDSMASVDSPLQS